MKDGLKKLKNKLAKNKRKGIAALAVICILAFAFWYGGNGPGLKGWSISSRTAPVSASAPASSAAGCGKTTPSAGGASTYSTAPVTQNAAASAQGSHKSSSAQSGSKDGKNVTADKKLAQAKSKNGGTSSKGVEKGDTGYSESQGMSINPKTGKDRYRTDPVPSGEPVPVEPQNATITDKAETCTLSVRCDTILNNMDLLSRDKWELVPKDGVIFAAATVPFYKGENVFNVLQREMKKAKIQMEFKNTPMYNSAYIEGINNLYEFDAGDLSGWMYKVNGWFPNYGCSRYQLKDGDVVEWVYTCDLGKDVGGYYSVGS